jgi:hypothetical protein
LELWLYFPLPFVLTSLLSLPLSPVMIARAKEKNFKQSFKARAKVET